MTHRSFCVRSRFRRLTAAVGLRLGAVAALDLLFTARSEPWFAASGSTPASSAA